EKKKKKEMTLETALKELNIKTDTKKRKPCQCQATKHELLTVAPNCLNCGKIICVAEGVGPCTFCHLPILSSDKEAALIAEAKRKRAEQNQSQKQETASVGYAARVNGELFSQMYLFDDSARKSRKQQPEKAEGSKRKVMTIDSKSKQVIIENIDSASSSSSSEDEEPVTPSTRRGRDAFSAGTYANNPLLKEDSVPKFVFITQIEAYVKDKNLDDVAIVTKFDGHPEMLTISMKNYTNDKGGSCYELRFLYRNIEIITTGDLSHLAKDRSKLDAFLGVAAPAIMAEDDMFILLSPIMAMEAEPCIKMLRNYSKNGSLKPWCFKSAVYIDKSFTHRCL
ncbi:hypothetical protein CU097_000882, partial [Rhizopus azygosporus]